MLIVAEEEDAETIEALSRYLDPRFARIDAALAELKAQR